MYICAGCMLAAKFASMLVQVACLQLCLHVRLCRLHIYSYVCMYLCSDCISAAEFACTSVQVAYQQLSLHVCLCRLHVGG